MGSFLNYIIFYKSAHVISTFYAKLNTKDSNDLWWIARCVSQKMYLIRDKSLARDKLPRIWSDLQ